MSGQEIVIVIGVKVILRTTATAQRLAVADFLQIVQSAGDSTVAVAVEGVHRDTGAAIHTGVHLGALQNDLAVEIATLTRTQQRGRGLRMA